tara:strand:+ start:5110 stop:5514 length:405 start_codon:yes stop_codon:yes gene_type:complete
MTASAKAPTVRKTRTRKPKATAVKRQTVELSGGVTVNLPEANKTPLKKVSKKSAAPKAPKRPSARGLITPQRYLQDVKQRWAIHEYEINALVSDLVKGFNLVRPHALQLVEQAKPKVQQLVELPSKLATSNQFK